MSVSDPTPFAFYRPELDRIRERHQEDADARGTNHGHGYLRTHVDRYALLCFVDHLLKENERIRDLIAEEARRCGSECGCDWCELVNDCRRKAAEEGS